MSSITVYDTFLDLEQAYDVKCETPDTTGIPKSFTLLMK
jgi:hypothetical protein